MTIPPLAWLRPHPCTLPPPDANSLAARGITCTLSTFLVSSVPATYPYLPLPPPRHRDRLQSPRPLLLVLGPRPAPDGHRPARRATCVGVNGAWTRWTAINPTPTPPRVGREVKLGDPGLVPHPYFPAHLLWARRSGVGWSALSTVITSGARCGTPERWGAGRCGGGIARGGAAGRGGEREGEGDGEERQGREALRRIVSSDGEKQFEPPKKRARASLGGGAYRRRRPGPSRPTGTPFYAKPPEQHARHQGDARAGVACDAQAAAIRGWGSEDATFRATVNNHMQKEQQKGQTAPERMPFHPEFLRFMRETFASETAAADARLQTVALEAKVAQLEDENAMDVDVDAPVVAAQDPTPNTHLDAARARDDTDADTDATGGLGLRPHTGPTQRNISIVLRTPETTTTTRELERRIKELEAECAEAKATTARDAASLRHAEVCVSDQERKIASLEAVVTLRESTPLCPSLHAMLADDNIHQ
ncbi:hypothetical protein B0H14DRAFT_3466367 [Mycena olivaceomarginata]|nr:hypothetical protein B0H14DRAFT_3466367 [Mycena olivaceomarginata]